MKRVIAALSAMAVGEPIMAMLLALPPQLKDSAAPASRANQGKGLG